MSFSDPSDPRAVHLMGVAGAGMNALAEMLLRRGMSVTGCDLNPAACENLAALGARVLSGHAPEHVAGAKALIISSAIPSEHPEVVRARELGIPVVKRAAALGELVNAGELIGIAGTHGKTTTTVMTTLALASAHLAPTGVAGGRVGAWGSNLFPGNDSLFVVEADEYDRSFLALQPDVAVITNVEADHLDIYRDLEDIRGAFAEFAARAGVVLVCEDDPGARSIPVSRHSRRMSYGIAESGADAATGADIQARDIRFEGRGSLFSLWSKSENAALGVVRLSVPGVHNVRNALAAIGAGLVVGGEFDLLAAGVASFMGVERRFEVVGEAAGVTVVDDYAHHPTEIIATLSAARTVYPARRIVCAFQPHLFTRTRDFATEFGAALSRADAVLLTEIYPAREQPLEGVTAGLIERSLREHGGNLVWRGERRDLDAALQSEARSGDVVFTVGAGDVTHAARALLSTLAGREGR